jgi:hypothetical protein
MASTCCSKRAAWKSMRSEALQRGKESCGSASDESERMKSGGGRRE